MQPTQPGSWILESGTLRPNDKDSAMAERMKQEKEAAEQPAIETPADGQASAEEEAK